MEILGQPAQLGVPEAATIRLIDGRWMATDKNTRYYFICSQPLGGGSLMRHS